MVFTVNEDVAHALLKFSKVAWPSVVRTKLAIYPIAGFVSKSRRFVETCYSSGDEFDEVFEFARRISKYLV